MAREYWGKGLIKWHKSPEHALHTALSLQRKYVCGWMSVVLPCFVGVMLLCACRSVDHMPPPCNILSPLQTTPTRYCIDGADAVKHAGVLWCFGLFGIPQQPKRPVFGVLRTQQQYNEEERQATVRLLNGSSWGQAHVG